jgi:hypothetical protein
MGVADFRSRSSHERSPGNQKRLYSRSSAAVVHKGKRGAIQKKYAAGFVSAMFSTITAFIQDWPIIGWK